MPLMVTGLFAHGKFVHGKKIINLAFKPWANSPITASDTLGRGDYIIHCWKGC